MEAARGIENGEAGLTLVEVLVAFVILSLSTLAMMRVIGDTSGTIARVEARAREAEAVQGTLAALALAGPLQPGRRLDPQTGIAVTLSDLGPPGLDPAAPRPFRVTLRLPGENRPPLSTVILARRR